MLASWNNRKALLAKTIILTVFLIIISIGGIFMEEAALETDFSRKNLSPCFKYLFGTDNLGRDMFARTMCGLSASIRIGILASAFSSVIALVFGIAAALGKRIDFIVNFLIDLIMSVPHILFLIIISLCFGKGVRGVVIGLSLTHWTSLARVIRAEVVQLKQQPYIKISGKLGKGKLYIAFQHMLPHVFPQFAAGLVLMFPHAVLHEASITFLGFGLSNEQPAIGVILSESTKYLVSGMWWLAFFPGVMLVIVVICFYAAGNNLRKVLNSASTHN